LDVKYVDSEFKELDVSEEVMSPTDKASKGILFDKIEKILLPRSQRKVPPQTQDPTFKDFTYFCEDPGKLVAVNSLVGELYTKEVDEEKNDAETLPMHQPPRNDSSGMDAGAHALSTTTTTTTTTTMAVAAATQARRHASPVTAAYHAVPPPFEEDHNAGTPLSSFIANDEPIETDQDVDPSLQPISSSSSSSLSCSSVIVSIPPIEHLSSSVAAAAAAAADAELSFSLSPQENGIVAASCDASPIVSSTTIDEMRPDMASNVALNSPSDDHKSRVSPQFVLSPRDPDVKQILSEIVHTLEHVEP
jgi:hypothetical protein